MRLSVWPAMFGLALAMILVTIIQPVESSLSFASGAIVIIALLGWVLEAREIAGPDPEVEPEHEEEEEAPGPSYWPVILSLGIVGIAAGLVYPWEYGSLIVALPLALGAGAAWASKIGEEIAETEQSIQQHGLPIAGPGGRSLTMVPSQALTTQAAGGAAIALEMPTAQPMSRRGILRISFWTMLVAGLAATTASMIDMLYPRGITGFGSVINAGNISEFAPGTKTEVSAGKFWLVHLTEEQARESDPVNGQAGILALWWKCPHLGCTVPWINNYSYADKRGWFRCPCHGSTYDDAGVRVFGPAARSLDRMAVSIDPASGRISVDTGSIENGTPDNARFSVQA